MVRKTRKDIEAEFDALVDELGEPTPVTTTGPVDTDVQDLNATGRELDAGAAPSGQESNTTTVRTKRQAIEWGRGVMRSRQTGWAGLCLKFVRSCYGIEALYPDAITAWDEAVKRHRCSIDEAPRGYSGFFRGGEHGHVVLLLGRGRCLSNDTGDLGTINVARLADIEAAWGYVFLGYTDDLNGETAPAPRSSTRPRLNRSFRLKLLRQALVRARQAGHYKRARVIRAWIANLVGTTR